MQGTTAYLALTADPKTSEALNALWSAVVRRAESTDTSPASFPVADLLDDASVSAPLFAPMAYASAFRAIRAGSYDEALAALKQAVAFDPLVVDRGLQSPEAKTGIAALRQKDVRVAVASLEAASKRNPESAEVQRILGMALALARQHETSLTHLREASRLNPQDERSRIAMADVTIASGKPDAALESLRETLRVMPESAEAYWQVGRIEQALGDADAVRSFERAATKPVVAGLARLYAIIGQAYHAQFDLDGAAKAYRQRVEIAPNDRDAHFDLAEIYRGQDKLDEARVEYLAAAMIDPTSAKTFGMLGQVEAAAGRDEEAVVDAAPRGDARCRTAGGAVCAQPCTASPRADRGGAAGAARVRSRPGQGDGRAAPSVPRQPAEDRRSAEDQMRRVVLGAAMLLAVVSLRAQSNVTFDNVAKAVGLTFTHVNGASADKYLVETMGSGAAFLDYDNDGWIDLFVVDGGSIAAAGKSAAKHRLFHNDGKGNFADVTAASGIVHREYGMGACAGDVDGDGRTDLYVTNYGPNALYRNAGNGAFTDITRTARVGLDGWSTSCAFLDVDRDGDLDLFIANYLDAPPSKNPFCGDPQRRIRVYCHPLNYTGLPSVLYRNDGKGVFTDVSAEAGIVQVCRQRPGCRGRRLRR